MLRFLPLCLLLLPLWSCVDSAQTDNAPASFPATPYVSTTSHDGKWQIEIRTAPSQPPTRGLITAQLRVQALDGKTAAPQVTGMQPWMPAMNHGSSVAPVLTPQGDGQYLVDNLWLTMAGAWTLHLTLDDQGDYADPVLQIQ